MSRFKTTEEAEDDDETQTDINIGYANYKAKVIIEDRIDPFSEITIQDPIQPDGEDANNSRDSSKLMENNVLKRETFIDNNFNKKLRHTEFPEQNVIDEVYTNSDMRIKRYGILFNFINNNLKELTDLVNNQNTQNNITNNNRIIEETIEGYSFENISSFLANSFHEDFYKGFVDQTINLTGVNVSNANEVSSMRTKMGISMFDKSEKTECQYDAGDSVNIDFSAKREDK
jgi:hypothetical protein